MFSNPAKNVARLGLVHGMKVIDLGAGSGFYALAAAKVVGDNGRVYAVDVQKNILDRIRNTAAEYGLRNIESVWGDAEKLGGTKLGQDLADRIIASNLVFQLQKPDDFVLECKRLLKSGGKILIIDWSQKGPFGPKEASNEGQVKTLFEKNNFVLEERFDAGDHHYGLIFKKL